MILKNLNLLEKMYDIEVRLQKVNTIKTILLNLKQRQLSQVFVIILMHLF